MTLREFAVSRFLDRFILCVIILNAISFGVETSAIACERIGGFLLWFDRLCLWIYTLEIVLKIWVLKAGYFRNGWNVFDFVIVAGSYLIAGSSVLRGLRVMRVWLLVSAMPRLRVIVRSLIISLPSIGSIALLLSLIFYACAVMATHIFGQAFPAWFGTLSESIFTLFQIMTLESWAMGIVRPVCEQFPYAPYLFVPFVLISSFIIMNLFVAIIIGAMSEAREQMNRQLVRKVGEQLATRQDELERIYSKLQTMGEDLAQLTECVGRLKEQEGINPSR